MQRATAKGFRLHIGIFGRRNTGKSSLLNALTRQHVSIVSATAGTTTDPVEKPMELQPLGPVLFVDTAGIDDVGALGEERIAKTQTAMARTDLALLVAEAGVWTEYEERLVSEFRTRGIAILVAGNKCDLLDSAPAAETAAIQHNLPCVRTSALTGEGLAQLRAALVDLAPETASESPAILRDLVPPGSLAVLVTPIDREAPKGRIKQLQVQCIRDLLDHEAASLVVKETGLAQMLGMLRTPPALIVTDAQVFAEVAAVVPATIPLTAFSILFSRLKGDLIEQSRAVAQLDKLHPGDRVLIAESCTHHPVEDDIGRVKIPGLLRNRVGSLTIDTVQGRDFPVDLTPYSLVIHCGACMGNRAEMLSRIAECRRQHTPITNYGLLIAHAHGILERALAPFPQALSAFLDARRQPALASATGQDVATQ